MRCAAAQAVIAEALVSHIFQPFYLPMSANGSANDNIQQAATVLLKYLQYLDYDEVDENLRREVITRCQLREVTVEAEDKVVHEAGNQVHMTLAPLLPPTGYIPFQNRLNDFFKMALEVWRPVQFTEEIVAGMVPGSEGVGNAVATAAEFGDDVASPDIKTTYTMLFPQVAIPGVRALYDGTVLSTRQESVVAAINERMKNGGSAVSSTERTPPSLASTGTTACAPPGSGAPVMIRMV